MEQFVKRIQEFHEMTWTKTALIICFTPLALGFILLHWVLFMVDEHSGAVVSNTEYCARIGKIVLKEGGSVVDAVIAIMFCESVLLPKRVGIGGGFSAVMYMQRRMQTIVATPRAPSKAEIIEDEDFFDSMSMSVPGTLMGCWQMHRKYGLLPWKRLLEPAIELCENGVPREYFMKDKSRITVTNKQRRMIMQHKLATSSNSQNENKIKFPVLSQTLRLIATKGADVFYNGSIGEDIIRDIQEDGGVMEMDDLRAYNVTWSRAVSFNMKGYLKAYTTPLPTSGVIVALAINTIKGMIDKKVPTMLWHQTIETMKHAYGLSFDLADIEGNENDDNVTIVNETFSKMIDPDFAVELRHRVHNNFQHNLNDYKHYNVRHRPNYQSTASSICVSGPGGDAIALTADMGVKDQANSFFSKTTGIWLNNEMYGFKPTVNSSMPNSPNFFVKPHKRAFSSHCPVLVLYKPIAEVFLLVGASGNEAAAAQVITALIKICFERQSALNASNSFFFVPDLMKEKTFLELLRTDPSQVSEILKFLKQQGHNVSPSEGRSNFPHASRSVIFHNTLRPEAEFTLREEDGGSEIIDPKIDHTIFLIFIINIMLAIIIGYVCTQIIKKTKRDELPFAQQSESQV